MEITFGGSNCYLSSDFNVNGEISFSSESWSFNINYANCLNILFFLAALYDIDEIFGFSWLWNQYYGFSFDNIVVNELDWIQNVDFLEAFKLFEEVVTSASSIERWSTA